MCSQCGSRDLSTPEPNVPLWATFVEIILQYGPGLLLLVITVLFGLAFLQALLTSDEFLGRFLVLTLVLAIVWWLYMKLPRFVRRGIGQGVRKLSGRNSGERR